MSRFTIVTRRLAAGLIVCLAGALVLPVAAGAAAWPLESEARVLVPYGSSYVRDGRAASHSGIDLAAEEGAGVLVPVSGTVGFVGRVPAAGGGTMLAVTVRTADGLSFTLMPLAECSLVKDEQVAEGERLGSLAGTGDASSDASHLHIGVRRGEAYLDPAGFIGAFAEAQGREPAVEPATADSAAGRTPEPPVLTEIPQATTVQDLGMAAESTRPQVDSVADPAIVRATDPVRATGGEAAVAPRAASGSPAESPVAPNRAVSPQRFLRAHVPVRTITPASAGRVPAGAGLLLVGGLALWPLWRRRTGTITDVRPRFDDVAATVTR